MFLSEMYILLAKIKIFAACEKRMLFIDFVFIKFNNVIAAVLL